jgi:hypothetical protein
MTAETIPFPCAHSVWVYWVRVIAANMIFTTFYMGWGVVLDGKRVRHGDIIYGILSNSLSSNDGDSRTGNILSIIGNYCL